MDENALRDLLERATREEPPMGRLSVNALREGIRLRRRRRSQSAATAAVAAIAVVGIVPVLATHGNVAAHAAGTAYVATSLNEVVPVNLATDTAGQPIRVAPTHSFTPMAIAPNGRTIYVTSATGLVTPIYTTTNKTGTPINLHSGPLTGITISPNGKAAYVIAATGVIPVDLVSRKAGHMIRTPYAQSVVVAPNGKFAYVLGQQDVIPIRVATGTGLRPIPVSWDSGIAFSPNGRTAYALSTHDKQRPGELIPISTTTNAAGTPIYLGGFPDRIAVIPHSAFAYVEDSNGSIAPVNLVTRTVGLLINAKLGLGPLTISPDGRALYAFSFYSITVARSAQQLTEIGTARGNLVRDIRIKGLFANLFAISPDGGTGFVVTGGPSLTYGTSQLVPIHLANNKVGRPIRFGNQPPVEILFTG